MKNAPANGDAAVMIAGAGNKKNARQYKDLLVLLNRTLSGDFLLPIVLSVTLFFVFVTPSILQSLFTEKGFKKPIYLLLFLISFFKTI